MVCGFGILQGILMAGLVYFHPKSDRSVNSFLSLYIFITSAVMALPFALEVIGWQKSYFIMPLPMLAGPILYFYIRSFKEKITWQKMWPHFIAFFVFLFLVHKNITYFSAQYPNADRVPQEVLSSPTTIALQLSRLIQQLIYFVLTRKALLSYQRSIQHLFSETSRMDLRWGKFLVNGYLLLISSFVIIFPLMLRFHEYFNELLLLNMVLGTVYIYFATYKGAMQHTIWQVQPGISRELVQEEIIEVEEIKPIVAITAKQKITKPGLSADKIEDLADRIVDLMETDKLYQETELTLQQLAGKLQVPTYQVSQSLNEGLKKNFYDLVNGYRVEEAKRLLQDVRNRNYTILSVGFEAGFNSKTTFNTVFKKFTGFTPTEFRDKQKLIAIPA
ncbi:MAG TPA: helix-turn-helix transcriptional regulator [Chitinophagaceae bacterium]